mgnify:CR=1 FL=1
MRIKDYVNFLIKKLKLNVKVIYDRKKPDGVYRKVLDVKLAKKYGWKAKYSLNEGLTEKEIYEYLIDQYGQWITYDPEFNQKTLILWALPILLFIIGGAIIFRILIVLK